jgi:hypothetical protein
MCLSEMVMHPGAHRCRSSVAAAAAVCVATSSATLSSSSVLCSAVHYSVLYKLQWSEQILLQA